MSPLLRVATIDTSLRLSSKHSQVKSDYTSRVNNILGRKQAKIEFLNRLLRIVQPKYYSFMEKSPQNQNALQNHKACKIYVYFIFSKM